MAEDNQQPTWIAASIVSQSSLTGGSTPTLLLQLVMPSEQYEVEYEQPLNTLSGKVVQFVPQMFLGGLTGVG
jgi:hypothetical protein